MKSALDIAHDATLRPITEIATQAGILPNSNSQAVSRQDPAVDPRSALLPARTPSW
jgi:hypothetical protein